MIVSNTLPAIGQTIDSSNSNLRCTMYLFDLQVNEIAGACHSCHSYHYRGTAVDIDPGSRKQELINKCSSMGGWPNDEINHIHCQFNH